MHNNFQEEFKELYTKDSDGIYILDAKDIKSAIKCLKDEDEFHFLVDITAVDYSKYIQTMPSRFGVVYLLRNKDFKEVITIKSFLDDEKLEIETISETEWKVFITEKAMENLKPLISEKIMTVLQGTFDGKSSDELAEKLNATQATIRVYRRRGKNALKKEILRLNAEMDA